MGNNIDYGIGKLASEWEALLSRIINRINKTLSDALLQTEFNAIIITNYGLY